MLIRVFDTETTGFGPQDGVVEIGYTELVSVGPNNWMIGRQDSTFLNPGRPSSREAFAVHGIDDEWVKNAPSAKYASNYLHWGDVPPDYIVAHNAKFDMRFVEARNAKTVCTLLSCKHVFPGFSSYKNVSLFNALKGVELVDTALMGEAHRVRADTLMTAAILLRLLEKLNIDELVAITAGKPIDTIIPFGPFKGLKLDDANVPDKQLQWLYDQPWVSEKLKDASKKELERRKATGWKPKI